MLAEGVKWLRREMVAEGVRWLRRGRDGGGGDEMVAGGRWLRRG